jgi:hypothetical protein
MNNKSRSFLQFLEPRVLLDGALVPVALDKADKAEKEKFQVQSNVDNEQSTLNENTSFGELNAGIEVFVIDQKS